MLAGFLSVAGMAGASDALLNRLEPKGYVNDFANVIPADYERRIESVIAELKQKTGAEIAVVTIKSLEGGNIDDFTNRLFAKWGIGQQGKDNGLMFLCAMQDRKMRIEVGYGLEGAISDSRAGSIRRDVITPHFKSGNPQVGILAGVKALSVDVADEYGVTLSFRTRSTYRTQSRSSGMDWGWVWLLVILFGVIGWGIYHQIKHVTAQPSRRGRRYWDGSYGSSHNDRWGGGGGFGGFGGGGGGFGGGGFGGFGGGCSGGGGSSGGW